MAGRAKPPPPPGPAELTVEQMKRGITQLSRRVADLEAFSSSSANEDEVMALERSIDETLERVFGRNSSDYDRYRSAATLDDGPISIDMGGFGGSRRDTQRYLAEGRNKAIALLRQAMRGLQERVDDSAPSSNPPPPVTHQPTATTDQIFIVHGHDEATREAVARFVGALGLRPVILHEQPNRGQTIIEKFERNSDVGFAIILLTPDDLGGKDARSLQPRARQNVVLELGYFVGKLGRAKVCAIVRGPLEVPSDIHGVVWTPFEGNWKLDLAKELRAAGYEIDLNKAL